MQGKIEIHKFKASLNNGATGGEKVSGFPQEVKANYNFLSLQIEIKERTESE